MRGGLSLILHPRLGGAPKRGGLALRPAGSARAAEAAGAAARPVVERRVRHGCETIELPGLPEA